MINNRCHIISYSLCLHIYSKDFFSDCIFGLSHFDILKGVILHCNTRCHIAKKNAIFWPLLIIYRVRKCNCHLLTTVQLHSRTLFGQGLIILIPMFTFNKRNSLNSKFSFSFFNRTLLGCFMEKLKKRLKIFLLFYEPNGG